MRYAILTILLLSTQPSFANDRIFVVDPQGEAYELKAGKKALLGFGKPSGLDWQKVDPAQLSVTDWRAAGNTRITSSGLVEIDGAGTGQFVDSGFRSPPSGITYKQAALDSQGNLVVTLGGSGKGFNYMPSGANAPILSNRMQWDPGPLPTNFTQVMPVPGDTSLIAVGEDKELYRIEPATRAKREFEWTKIAGGAGSEDLFEVEGKIVATGKNGAIEVDVSNGSAQAKSLGNPNGVPANARVYSNRGSLTQLQAAAQPPAPPPAAAVAATSNGASSTKAAAQPASPPPPRPATSVADDLAGLSVPGNQEEGFKAFVAGTDSIFNDDLIAREKKGEVIQFIGRDKEADEAVDVLARIKGKNPVLLGEPGVGKTTVAEILAQMMLDNKMPPGSAFDELRNGIVVQTTAGKISSLALSDDPQSQQQAMEAFLKGLRTAEAELKRPIVLYIDEMHTLSEPQLQALKPYLDSSSKGVKFLGSTTHNEYGRLIKDDPAMERRLAGINVAEFDEEKTFQVLKNAWVPKLEKRYNLDITDEALRIAIREAPGYLPNSHRPEGPFKLLQDVAVAEHRAQKGAAQKLEPRAVQNHLVKSTGSPLNPYDRKDFAQGITKLREEMRDIVVDQEKVTDTMVDLWEEINEGIGKKSHRTMLVAGPTGAGKTFSAQTFAKKVLGSEDRMLEIDATKFKTGGASLNSLLGAPPGIVSSDKSRGLLPEFLAGRGKGQNVIVINEIDKAHPDLLEALMEMLDTGKLQGQDGKTYSVGKSLVVFTTNKGDEAIYPRGRGGALNRKELKERTANIDDKRVRGFFMQPDPGNQYDTSKMSPASVLQRIDRAVPAVPPSAEGAAKVAAQEVGRLSKDIERKFGYKVKLDPTAAEALVAAHYIPEDGIRNVNREAEKLVRQAVKEAEAKGNLERGQELAIRGEREGAGIRYKAEVTGGAQPSEVEWTAANPRGHANPMSDPAQRELLNTMEDRLEKHVMGQPDFVATAARAMRAKAVNAADPKPATMLVLGPTGTGKTEIFKAIAKEKFGNEARMVAFDMGKVKWDGDMNNIFGSPVGIIGSDKMSPFEKFLNDFPEGGVIVFDEIGNMGGGGTAHAGGGNSTKEDLLKKFYSMLDEGKWTSPHGKVYDLKKYVLGFTSNEGQEVFNGLPADDLRLAAWKKGKSPEQLRAILKKHGWPEAFVARFGGNIALAKPLLEEERQLIAKKLADRTMNPLKEAYGLKEVKYDKNFFPTAAGSFFTHEEGGRKLRDLAEIDLADLVSQAVLSGEDPAKLKGAELEFSIRDNFAGKTSHPGFRAPERKVEVEVRVTRADGTESRFSADVSSRAAEKRLASRMEGAQTAYHEAAHAVVNDAEKTGQKLAHVTIKGQGNFGGYARYEELGKQSLNRENVVSRIGMMLAGMKAEKRVGFPVNSGWMQDTSEARRFAHSAITQMNLGTRPLSLPLRDGTVDPNSRMVQEEVDKLLLEGDRFADERIARDWPEIKKVADALYKRKFLEGPDFEKIVTESREGRIRELRAKGVPEIEIRRLVGGVQQEPVAGGNISRTGRVRGVAGSSASACSANFEDLVK